MDMENSINVKTVETMENQQDNGDKVKILLDGLAKGECKGVKGATAYKVAEYAQQKGLI